METKTFYEKSQICALLSRYLSYDEKTLKERFDKVLEDLKSGQCRIPVLGVQGAGKSSFLNAVLFGDILLPVDANETTCIPTEIHYGDNAEIQATVVFANGSRKQVSCTEKGLAQYVHQDNNPHNKLDVSHIEISFRNDLLKNGLVLVDLPGVGSITLENQKATLDYLRKSSAAIFLLRTVPPMTRSESVFVQSALPFMNSVFWVQNQWTDESEEEVTEGCDYNESKLRQIAEKVHKSQDYVTRPTIVCVKKALDGKIDDNPKMVAESNLVSFMERIVHFADEWRCEIQKQLREDAREFVSLARKKAVERKEELESILSGDVDKARAELEKQYQHASEIKEKNRQRKRVVDDFVHEQKQQLLKNIQMQCRTGAENLRNNVRELIDSGVTGGARLEQAYNDCAKEVNEEIFKELQEPFITLTEGTRQYIEELQPVSLNKEKAKLTVKASFSEKSKAPTHYGKIGAGAGAVAGAAIGSIIPGVGTAIGAIAGSLIGGLLGGWGGKKIASVQVDRQREIARDELFRQIKDFQETLEGNYRNILDDFVEGIDNSLRTWMKEQSNMLEQEYEERSKSFMAEQKETKGNLEQVEGDIETLSGLAKELE